MAGETESSARTPRDVAKTDPDGKAPAPVSPVAARGREETTLPSLSSVANIDLSSSDMQDAEPSSVRPFAATMHGPDSPDAPAQERPVVIRTPPPMARPRSSLDLAVGALSTTTPTGRDPSSSPVPSPKTPSSKPSARGLIGTTLGRYEIIEELGHGGMATVYRAHDPRLDRDVALKVIHNHLRDNPEIAQRFRHEAQAVAKLKHRSIVEIYDVPDTDDGERFLVAEYVDGPSLRRWLQGAQKERSEGASAAATHGMGKGPVMPPEIAAALVMQVLSALARAHAEGIIHRDVKPENILIAGLGAPTSQRPSDPNRAVPIAKLTDFGIAKILDAASMTSTGQILGSPAHMAPEQIEGGDVTARVDVFATGVLFYELLTGALPFDGKNPAQVIRRVLDGQFTPADRVVPTVGGRWSAIVAAMLARDPLKRPATIDAVCAPIKAELDALGIVDPDGELVSYLRDPDTVVAGWGERMKPKLLERAMEARARGDVVGAANDLNRALAYDPSDPRLARAVGSIRSRERRLRLARRLAPIVVVAVAIASGTFFGVRWLQNRTTITTTPSTSTGSGIVADGTASPKSTEVAGGPPSTTTFASIDAGTKPTNTATAGTGTQVAIPTGTGTTTGSTATVAQHVRRVRFNMFPPGKFTIDGGPELDSFSSGTQEISIGDHAITATGGANCCEAYKGSAKITEGEGDQTVDIRLKLNPARVFVSAPEGVSVHVTVKTKAGVQIASGTAPLSVTMTETSLPVTIVLEAPGLPAKTVEDTLRPGDARYEEL
jgi:eukaryotic-like serine/threonine-protein kinase